MNEKTKNGLVICLMCVTTFLVGVYVLSTVNMWQPGYEDYAKAPSCISNPPTNEGLCKVSEQSWYWCKNTTSAFEPYISHGLGCQSNDRYDVRS